MDKCLRPPMQLLILMLISKKVLESRYIGKRDLRVLLEKLMRQLVETNLTF